MDFPKKSKKKEKRQMVGPVLPGQVFSFDEESSRNEVCIFAGDQKLRFQVRMHPCAGRTHPFTYMTFASPPVSNRSGEMAQLTSEQRFWVRILEYYRSNCRPAGSRDKQSDDDMVMNSYALVHVGLAFPQRFWLVERKGIDFMMKKKIGYQSHEEDSLAKMDESLMLNSEDIAKYLATVLAPKLFSIERETERDYQNFERELINEVLPIIAEKMPFNEKLRAIKDHCEGIRKQANEETRILLDRLQSHVDTALYDMYQYGAEAIIDAVERRRTERFSELTQADIVVNRFFHSVREEYGGIVFALHPIGQLILESEWAVERLKRHCLAPENESATHEFNGALLAAVNCYEKMIEADPEVCPSAETDLSGHRYDEAASRPIRQIADPRENPANTVKDKELLVALDRILGDHPDGNLFRDRRMNELSVAECAQKYRISNGEVTKRVQALERLLKKERDRI